MISEPEMVPEGYFGAAELPQQRVAADDVVTEGQGQGPGGPRRARPAWLWALGGAVVASAVWAGGLYVHATAEPDLGGYRESRNLCLDAELNALTAAIGERVDQGSAWRSTHESLDDVSCYIEMRPQGYELPTDEDGNELGSLPSVSVGYTLHKKTDPGPEFEGMMAARHTAVEDTAVDDAAVDDATGADGTTALRRVDGLGELAFVVRDSGGVTLEVLDGQAVVSLSTTSDWDAETGEPLTDVSDFEPMLVEDMRALLARLKS
ncbi:hypothetical protein GLX30_13495 [Streptomyces sp. Tu 2975]|uniref:hypothetical protein n=1 Tax=Streptomyces sp. Tu 2975 TaxID=2676871 RepID=UPI001358206E|nr:hypothetical protein [Streptomyces sp. Tu 2975]QIP84874.1 hypothetical protein GLX30_13495 [Streptomyces sp. Tu 2975]